MSGPCRARIHFSIFVAEHLVGLAVHRPLAARQRIHTRVMVHFGTFRSDHSMNLGRQQLESNWFRITLWVGSVDHRPRERETVSFVNFVDSSATPPGLSLSKRAR